jgi:hypothetical protein
MKKYIFSVLMAAMAAFTFSSCEDVPEPYTLPTKPEAGGTTQGEPKGTGTAADPFNSIAAIKTENIYFFILLSFLLMLLYIIMYRSDFC